MIEDRTDKIIYKGKEVNISSKLRRYYVYHSGYDFSPSDARKAVFLWCKDNNAIESDVVKDGTLGDIFNDYMRGMVRVYRQEFNWHEDKAKELSPDILEITEDRIKRDSKWKKPHSVI